jgi:hypothetical protein
MSVNSIIGSYIKNKLNLQNIIKPYYGSFLSTTTQLISTIPTAITYTEKTIGNINVIGSYPNSIIVCPISGVYKILFSAQCEVSNGKHYIEIWPVIDGVSVPKSNTRIRLDSQIENCLTVEYFLSMNLNQQLQFYMISDDNSKAKLLYLSGDNSKNPVVPEIPSIIVNMILIR